MPFFSVDEDPLLRLGKLYVVNLLVCLFACLLACLFCVVLCLFVCLCVFVCVCLFVRLFVVRSALVFIPYSTHAFD